MEDVRKKLKENAEPKYQKFMQSLIPGCKHILGVRMPVIKKIAKDFSQEQMQQYLCHSPHYLEEHLLQAIFIGKLFYSTSDFALISGFVPKINNWAVCDCFCTNLKFSAENKDEMLKFLTRYFNSHYEFEIRFAMVMLLNYFIEEPMLSYIFARTENFNHQGYYAQMSVAWLLSQCFAKFEQRTLSYLKVSSLDNVTYNKTIQKILESQKVSKDLHWLLKSLKRH